MFLWARVSLYKPGGCQATSLSCSVLGAGIAVCTIKPSIKGWSQVLVWQLFLTLHTKCSINTYSTMLHLCRPALSLQELDNSLTQRTILKELEREDCVAKSTFSSVMRGRDQFQQPSSQQPVTPAQRDVAALFWPSQAHALTSEHTPK